MDKHTAEDAKLRLARIAGQVNGVEKMVETDRYCVDILTQVNAVRSAVNQLGVVLLSMHLEKCIQSDSPDCSDTPLTPQQQQDEIRTTLRQFLETFGQDTLDG